MRERERVGGRKSENRRQRSAVLGGQRCRHRKPLLLQATEDGRQRERRRREKTGRERERRRREREREAPSISEASPTRGRGLKSTTADSGRRS